MTTQNTKSKKYYAAHSYMGLGYEWDAICWVSYSFNSKSERDAWVAKNEYSQTTNQYVAQAITAKEYAKIKNKREVCEQIKPTDKTDRR